MLLETPSHKTEQNGLSPLEFDALGRGAEVSSELRAKSMRALQGPNFIWSLPHNEACFIGRCIMTGACGSDLLCING